MPDRILNLPLDYLICFVTVLREIKWKVWYMSKWLQYVPTVRILPLFWCYSWKYNIQVNERLTKIRVTLMQIQKSLCMFGCIEKSYVKNFAFLILIILLFPYVYKYFMFAHLSECKRCYGKRCKRYDLRSINFT